ncbi:hypothetical protein [Arthrobacter sp. UYCu723]
MTATPPGTSPQPWIFSANGVLEALTWPQAVDALESTLAAGFDPETDPDRHSIGAAGGHMLLMPSSTGQRVGVKVLTVRNGPDATGALPMIQGAYVLFDGDSMAPLAILDGAALTKVRTAATSALAIRHLTDHPLPRLVVFGTGSQAHGHASALHATAGVEHVDVVARDPARGEAFVRKLRSEGIPASVATPAAVSSVEIIACTSSTGAPLFSGDAVRTMPLSSPSEVTPQQRPGTSTPRWSLAASSSSNHTEAHNAKPAQSLSLRARTSCTSRIFRPSPISSKADSSPQEQDHGHSSAPAWRGKTSPLPEPYWLQPKSRYPGTENICGTTRN